MGLFTRQTKLAMDIAESTKLTRKEKDRAFEELLMEMHMEGAWEERQRLSSVDIADLEQQMHATDKMLAVTIAHAGLSTESVCEDDEDFKRYAAMTSEQRNEEFHRLNQQVIAYSEKGNEEVWEREQRVEALENAEYSYSAMSVSPVSEVYNSMRSHLTAEEEEQAEKLHHYFQQYFREHNVNVLVGTVVNLSLALVKARDVEDAIMKEMTKK